MVSWRYEWAVPSALFLALGCSVGGGQGSISGSVVAPDCEVDEPAYELTPSFFSGEVTEAQMNIRVQRGSDIEGYADGVMIQIRDVNEVFRNRIGIPIPVDPDERSLVQVIFYLNQTCPSGFPDFFVTQPLILEGQSGSIVFDAVYAPDIEAGSTLIAGELRDVQFATPDDPERTHATLSGTFSFFYQRGSPAQRFP
ncbi:MAG: hypothetical protein H6719_02590 [Sandaracinaceae bacterium]|nr:hypothetical protein [Sandaracinaceae bacterium]